MNFWATIEHSLNYKYGGLIPEDVKARLTNAAREAAQLDLEMGEIREDIQEAQLLFDSPQQKQMNFGKKVWLIGNSSEKSKKTLNKLSKILKAEHFVFDDINPEIVISVGGDGTLLRAMHMYEYQLDRVRFLGVHTGHLGFYTDFTDEDLFEVVEALYDENPAQAIHYPLIRVQVSFTDGYQIVRHVLNEATIRRASKTMVGDVRISDYLFERFRGDGLSISTPTGSTAYNCAHTPFWERVSKSFIGEVE